MAKVIREIETKIIDKNTNELAFKQWVVVESEDIGKEALEKITKLIFITFISMPTQSEHLYCEIQNKTFNAYWNWVFDLESETLKKSWEVFDKNFALYIRLWEPWENTIFWDEFPDEVKDLFPDQK